MGDRTWVPQGTLVLHTEGGWLLPHRDEVLVVRARPGGGSEIDLAGRYAGHHAVREAIEDISEALASDLPARWLEG